MFNEATWIFHCHDFPLKSHRNQRQKQPCQSQLVPFASKEAMQIDAYVFTHIGIDPQSFGNYYDIYDIDNLDFVEKIKLYGEFPNFDNTD